MNGFSKLAGMAALAVAMTLSGCVMIESSSIGERRATGQGATATAAGYGI